LNSSFTAELTLLKFNQALTKFSHKLYGNHFCINKTGFMLKGLYILLIIYSIGEGNLI